MASSYGYSSRRRRYRSSVPPIVGGSFSTRMQGAGGQATQVAAPNFVSPITGALDALRGRQASLQGTIDKPLDAPGVRGTLTTLNDQLARKNQANQGAVMGRAAASGQAGFSGAFAQTAAELEGATAGAMAKGQTDLVSSIVSDAQKAMDQNYQTQGNLESQLNQQQLEQARIAAEIAAGNADREYNYYNSNQQSQNSNLNYLLGLDQLNQRADEFDVTSKQHSKEFDTTARTAIEQRDYERNRQAELDKAAAEDRSLKNSLTRLSSASALGEENYDIGGLNELLSSVGIPSRFNGYSSMSRGINSRRKSRYGFNRDRS